MAKTIIQTENLCFTYPDGTSALIDINIKIKEGERVAVVGSNGAGKSTLFAHFNGINKPSSGLIKIDGESTSYEKKELLKIRQKKWVLYSKILMISSLHQLLLKMWHLDL